MPESTMLHWRSLTAAVNEIKSPNRFLSKLLFGRHQTFPTETVEYGQLDRARICAPFVRKNGAAISTGGHTESFIAIEPTNIRIKRPFTPSDLLYNRRPGSVIHAEGGTIMQAMREHISRDLQGLADDIVNSEEWLAAMAIRGTISYEVADQESFLVTFNKPSSHNITLTGDMLWDNADPTLPKPVEDFHTVKKLLSNAVGLGVTDAIMGEEAATAFRTLMASNALTGHYQKINTGETTFSEQFNEDGVIYLGTFCGVRCWEYSRSATLDGTATPMIRSKYVEFVAATPAAEFVTYYGAIADMKALQGNKFQGERFSKSWEEEDPSALQALLASRPLPCMRRPGACVSMKVVSG